jgi:MarR family transcriptional regulator, temperature-dependent positive regulator of motility
MNISTIWNQLNLSNTLAFNECSLGGILTVVSSLKRILKNNEIAYGYRIGYLFNQFSGPVYQWTTAELGLQRPEFAVLFCIAHLPETTATDVATLTGIPKNSVSRAVNKLIELEFIERRTDSQDARRSLLSLTATGREQYQQILPRFKERQQRMMSVLTAQERAEFNRLLNKLVERGDDWVQAL